MRRERWNVFPPFAQRRDFDRKDAQAIEEVIAEAARIDLLEKIAEALLTLRQRLVRLAQLLADRALGPFQVGDFPCC